MINFFRLVFISSFTLILLICSQISSAQHCNLPFTERYECLNANGVLIGYVGPFKVKNEAGICLPDFPSTSLTDPCEWISKQCNENVLFRQACDGGCKAGDASGGQVVSCRGI